MSNGPTGRAAGRDPITEPDLDRDESWQRLRDIVDTYTNLVTPRLQAQEVVAHVKLAELGRADIGLEHTRLIREEITRLVHELHDLQLRIAIEPDDAELHERAAVLTAQLGCLAHIADRFTEEVLMPCLDNLLSESEREQVEEAMRAVRNLEQVRRPA